MEMITRDRYTKLKSCNNMPAPVPSTSNDCMGNKVSRRRTKGDNESAMNSEGKLLSSDVEQKKASKKDKYSSTKSKGKLPKPRVNYFVAIKITSPQIHNKLEKIQQHIVQLNSSLKLALIPLATLHITLLVLRIDEPEQLKRALEAMTCCHDALKDELTQNPLHLQFSGLSHFRNQVLYAEVKGNEEIARLKKLADTVAKCFEKNGFSLPEKGFEPHLTIMKLSRCANIRKKKGIKTIQPSLYAEYKDQMFGLQTVRGLQLLCMNRPKDPFGYYHLSKECTFDVPEIDLATLADKCSDSGKYSDCITKKPIIATPDIKNEIKRRISTITKAQIDLIKGEESSSESSEKEIQASESKSVTKIQEKVIPSVEHCDSQIEQPETSLKNEMCPHGRIEVEKSDTLSEVDYSLEEKHAKEDKDKISSKSTTCDALQSGEILHCHNTSASDNI